MRSFLMTCCVLASGAACAITSTPAYQTLLDDARARREPITLTDTLFAGDKNLDRGALIQAVLARNPDVDAARSAVRAVLARLSRVTSAEDPMLTYAFAPLSIAGDADFGQVVRIEQKVPLLGRRGLAGDMVLAEAEVMRADLEAVRLRLAEMASNAFDDYYVVERALEINDAHQELLMQIRASAEAQYVAGRASQQDPLQAAVELARLERERLELETERVLVVARLNGMLHRNPAAGLVPPPKELPVPEIQLDAGGLITSALADRPELRGQDAKVRGGLASRRLAERSVWPELSVMGEYNSMWDMPAHRWTIGVSLDVPLQRARRSGMVAEADGAIAGARDTRLGLEDQIRVEVTTAVERIGAARKMVTLYDERLMPLAKQQIDAARAGFVADRNDFQSVISAQKSQRDIELERARAVAELYRRLAELDRAVGRATSGAR